MVACQYIIPEEFSFNLHFQLNFHKGRKKDVKLKGLLMALSSERTYSGIIVCSANKCHLRAANWDVSD